MHQRPLGTTGLRVSALGLGAASFGGAYGDLDDREAIRAVHRAFAHGITLFDVSPYYGATRAETVLGQALRELPREQFVLSTKCGRYGVDDFDFRPERLVASLDESLTRLQLDHVDVLLLHDVEFGDLDRILAESLPALHALKATGKVRSVGLSGLPLWIFERALAAPTPPDVVLSYCHATLFDDSLTRLAEATAARGIGLLNASPAAMGLLTNQGPPAWHPAPADLRSACREAAAVCQAHGVELAEVALWWSAGRPGPASTLTGARTAGEVTANVAAAATPPPPAVLQAVRAALAPIAGRSWPQGRPANQGPRA